MNKLDTGGVRFFKKELLEETNRQLEMFEKSAPSEIASREFGRIRLYDDRSKIQRHFLITKSEIGAYEDSHPYHGIIGPLDGGPGSSYLIWKELEGLRHSLMANVEIEIIWEKESVPDVRLTPKGEFAKKKRHESLS